MSTTTARGTGVELANPQLADLDPVLREPLARFLLSMGDSELVIGHRHSEWTGFAPSAEEDVAFSSIAQDEMGHAHLYYALMTGAADEEAVDALALDRGPSQMLHLPVLHAPNGDWFFTIARQLYWEKWEQTVLTAALRGEIGLFASAARRLLNEEAYHDEHALEWLELLSSAPRPRARLGAALRRVIEIGGNPARGIAGLGRLGELRALPNLRDLAPSFEVVLRRNLEDAGGWSAAEIEATTGGLADPAPRPSPPGLRQLHRDLTGMRRAHPGASW